MPYVHVTADVCRNAIIRMIGSHMIAERKIGDATNATLILNLKVKLCVSDSRCVRLIPWSQQ
ncbi:hypothetical protein PG2071B_0256 [Bifidobacterium pseudolongum subsp. globosum]|uniref:Uncharacterized protein n=1 Tax=Bifidobacterium pseudolongum subsp. globosum TaxID=1690 RepID=A0A4Q5A8X1_9BIFI|nr:hypothetical protein PG2071B_0256 [Bifidobacterium pseudolongum subsp. globosum]